MKRIGTITIASLGSLLFVAKAHSQSRDTAQIQPQAQPQAQTYKTAIGIRISSASPAINNSISFKHFLTQRTAFEALLSFGDPIAIGILLEKHTNIGPEGLRWLVGGGAYLGFRGTRNIGLQGVLGIDYKVPTIPFNLTVDWKPELNLAKEFSFEPAAIAISARFTFNNF